MKDYARPRQEISRLLKKGELVRVKKGLYIVPSLSQTPFSREVLANLIYGPSYISLDYALRLHGLIPERVEEVTSVTCNRDKAFTTPVGMFSYRYLRPALFSLGVTRNEIATGRHVLVATPEKALVDKLWFNRQEIEAKDVPAYLFDDLRVDPVAVGRLSATRLAGIVGHYSDERLVALVEAVRRRKEGQ